MLSFDEFSSRIMCGESRNRPGVGCGYILIKESETEIFYAEWVYENIDPKAITDGDWDEVEKQDQEYAIKAYAAYTSGETEYIA